MQHRPSAPPTVQLDCPPAWHDQVVAALACAGVRIDPEAAVGVSVAPGRSVSPTVDDWTVASLPHVLVSVRAHAIEVGPWAVPGVGPCARCVAADVLDEVGALAPAVPPPPLLALAAGAVARDLATFSRGETPHTWLTSWLHDHGPVAQPRRWQRHPYCGCGWFETG